MLNSSLSNNILVQNLINIKRLLIKNKKSVSIAESCSGGYLSYYFTYLPDSSKFFKGSIVTYTNEIKKDILKVDKNLLNEYGAVSKEVSLDMAKNVLNKFSSDYGISITGNLGPTPSENKEIGLVYLTIISKDKNLTKVFHFKGNREEIRRKIIFNTIYLFKSFLKEDLKET